VDEKNRSRVLIPSEKTLEMPEAIKSFLLHKKKVKAAGRSVSERLEELIKAWKHLETTSKTYDEQVEALLQLLGEQEGEIDIKTRIVNLFRELWQDVSRKDERTKVSLAVVHGILERADSFCIQKAQRWLSEVYVAIMASNVDEAYKLEERARQLNCGLPVLDPERDPVKTTGFFGVVREIENGEARLSILIPESKRNPKDPLWESCSVPVVELPNEYANENVWIAWIERTYDFNGIRVVKGRFEPASLAPTTIDVHQSYQNIQYLKESL